MYFKGDKLKQYKYYWLLTFLSGKLFAFVLSKNSGDNRLDCFEKLTRKSKELIVFRLFEILLLQHLMLMLAPLPNMMLLRLAHPPSQNVCPNLGHSPSPVNLWVVVEPIPTSNSLLFFPFQQATAKQAIWASTHVHPPGPTPNSNFCQQLVSIFHSIFYYFNTASGFSFKVFVSSFNLWIRWKYSSRRCAWQSVWFSQEHWSKLEQSFFFTLNWLATTSPPPTSFAAVMGDSLDYLNEFEAYFRSQISQ